MWRATSLNDSRTLSVKKADKVIFQLRNSFVAILEHPSQVIFYPPISKYISNSWKISVWFRELITTNPVWYHSMDKLLVAYDQSLTRVHGNKCWTTLTGYEEGSSLQPFKITQTYSNNRKDHGTRRQHFQPHARLEFVGRLSLPTLLPQTTVHWFNVNTSTFFDHATWYIVNSTTFYLAKFG